MTDLDKTGAQLINSIRKTKEAPATAAASAAKEKKAAPVAKAAPAASKSASASQKADSTASDNVASPKVPVAAATPYPDGSTVWPD